MADREKHRADAIDSLRAAVATLGLAVADLRQAGLPASARAAERLRDRATALRHRVEDGEGR